VVQHDQLNIADLIAKLKENPSFVKTRLVIKDMKKLEWLNVRGCKEYRELTSLATIKAPEFISDIDEEASQKQTAEEGNNEEIRKETEIDKRSFVDRLKETLDQRYHDYLSELQN
jgi:hypothetical protein